MRKVIKLFNTKATSIDEANHTATFKISDNQIDRMGEIVDQKSWDFKNYLNNPIVLWGHDPSDPENVLGQTKSLDVSKDGSFTTATAQFDVDINSKAALIWNQIKRGTLRCVSVGFWPHTEEMQEDTPVLKDNELLEWSIVPIPANPRAVALDFKAGILSRKDAEWLIDGMTKEIDYLNEVMKQSTNDDEDTSMDKQLTNLITTLSTAVNTLVETAANQNEQIAALSKDVADLKDSLVEKVAIVSNLPCADEGKKWDADAAIKRVKAWASDDDGNIDFKKYRKAFFWVDGDGDKQGDYKLPFADVVDDKLQAIWHGVSAAYAAVKGSHGGVEGIDDDSVLAQIKKYYKKFGKEWPDDGKDLDSDEIRNKDASNEGDDADDGDEVADDTTDASEAGDESRSDQDDAAKDGGDDQSGAADGDELDEDAELTPELQAQLDEELEKGFSTTIN